MRHASGRLAKHGHTVQMGHQDRAIIISGRGLCARATGNPLSKFLDPPLERLGNEHLCPSLYASWVQAFPRGVQAWTQVFISQAFPSLYMGNAQALKLLGTTNFGAVNFNLWHHALLHHPHTYHTFIHACAGKSLLSVPPLPHEEP